MILTMAKLARPPHERLTAAEVRRRTQLRARRRALAARIQAVDMALARLAPPSPSNQPLSAEQFDRWFDQISDGLPELPPLPMGFSRADLYDDHD